MHHIDKEIMEQLQIGNMSLNTCCDFIATRINKEIQPW